MAPAAFDPYHKWLGIAPKDQPPNHYRLLGIDAFESDLDVISLAADQRMAHVRTFQTGQNAAVSQKLLNEIAAARICLLSPEKKAAYDRALQSRRITAQPTNDRQPPEVARRAATAPTEFEGLASELHSASSTRRAKRGRKAKGPSWAPAIGAILGVAAVGIVCLFAWKASDSATPASPAVISTTAPAVLPVESGGDPEPKRLPVKPAAAKTAAQPRIAPPDQPPVDIPPNESPKDERTTANAETSVAAPDNVPLPAAPPAPDIAYWSLDEGNGIVAGDRSGNGHSLALHDARWVEGRFGSALQFDGVKAFAEASSHLPELKVPYTISLWLRPAARQAPHAAVFGNHADAFVGSYLAQWQGNEGQYIAGFGDGQRWHAALGLMLEVDQWKHVAIVADGKELVLYRNGVVGVRGPAAGRLAPNPGMNFMLGRGYTKGRYFAGAIDEMRIYGRALSPIEVETLARDQLVPPAPSAPAVAAFDNRLLLLEPAQVYPATPANRRPIPAIAAREDARKQIRELLRGENKAAKSIDARIALAEKLKAMGLEAQPEPAMQFVLLEEAATTSTHAGIACTSIDELAARYAVDAFEFKVRQLDRIAKESPAGSVVGVADCCLAILSEAIAVDRLDVAPRLLASAKACAVKAKDRRLGSRITEQSKELDRLRKGWDQFRAAASILREAADDPAANQTVGRYFTLSKNDWDSGLRFLACGPDAPLKAAALMELATPGDVEGQSQLANNWWELALDEKPAARAVIQHHAADWYRKALHGLTGIEKLRAEQRIAELAKSSDTVSSTYKLFDWLGKVVADNQTAQSEVMGTGSGKSFQDVCANGGLLIGFDLTTGKFGAGYRFTSITSLTPVYLTKTGAVRGRTCGEGEGHVSIVANDGYAVGKIAVLIDGRLQGVRITFMRIRGQTLNPKDAYESEYVGGQERPGLAVLGNGKPIVGISGQWDEHVRRLAVIEIK